MNKIYLHEHLGEICIVTAPSMEEAIEFIRNEIESYGYVYNEEGNELHQFDPQEAQNIYFKSGRR